MVSPPSKAATYPQKPLDVVVGWFLPDGYGLDSEEYELSEPSYSEYTEWLADVVHTEISTDHRLGGRWAAIQNDPLPPDSESRGKACPLLQIAWDRDIGLCVGDGGTLYLWVWSEDLEAGQLQRVELNVQTS